MSENIKSPALKEEIKNINQEGWTGDKEGGAVVVIGKKEEAERLRIQHETEGEAADLATFIRLNKKVIVPAEEIEKSAAYKDLISLRSPEKGQFNISRNGRYIVIWFFDKDKNLAEVTIDLLETHIKELENVLSYAQEVNYHTQTNAMRALGEVLQGLGFSNISSEQTTNIFFRFKEEYEEKIKNQVRQQKSEEFDF